MLVSGDVIAVESRWVADGSRIVTEVTVETVGSVGGAAGATEVVVSQLGGTVDGLGMRTFPGAAVLAVGDRVEVVAHAGVDLAGRTHLVLDDVLARVPATSVADFVRTGPTTAGHYLFWESGCAFSTLDSSGTVAVPFATVEQVVDASIATWNDDTATCSYLLVKATAPRSAEVGNDGINLIKFRDVTWCRPAVDDDPMRCYSPSFAGITTITYINDASSPHDGAIQDADTEINGVDFAISVDGQTTSTQSCHAELQNTLTHELGHLHGLQHTCRQPSDPAWVDDNGSAVPLCTETTDPTILDATMYPFQACGETSKEMLTADDSGAICAIYPTANNPHTCAPVEETSGGCCEVGGAPGGSVGVATAILLLVRRRRVSSKG